MPVYIFQCGFFKKLQIFILATSSPCLIRMSRAEKVIRMGMRVQVCELKLFINNSIVMGICPKCLSTHWALGCMDNLVIQRVSNKPYQHPSYTFWLIVIVLIVFWHGWHNAYYWEFSYLATVCPCYQDKYRKASTVLTCNSISIGHIRRRRRTSN